MEAGPGPQVATASRKTQDAVSNSQVVLSIPQDSRTNCPHLPGTAPVAALKPRETPWFLANQDSGPAPAGSSSQPGNRPLSQNRGIHCPKRTLLPLTRHPCCIAYWTESGHLASGITDKKYLFQKYPSPVSCTKYSVPCGWWWIYLPQRFEGGLCPNEAEGLEVTGLGTSSEGAAGSHKQAFIPFCKKQSHIRWPRRGLLGRAQQNPKSQGSPSATGSGRGGKWGDFP